MDFKKFGNFNWIEMDSKDLDLTRIHFYFNPFSLGIDSNLYCQQPERLCQAIEIKQPDLINKKGVFYHNNVTHL